MCVFDDRIKVNPGSCAASFKKGFERKGESLENQITCEKKKMVKMMSKKRRRKKVKKLFKMFKNVIH